MNVPSPPGATGPVANEMGAGAGTDPPGPSSPTFSTSPAGSTAASPSADLQTNPYYAGSIDALQPGELSASEVRSRLMGPAIGVMIPAILWLLYVLFAGTVSAIQGVDDAPQDPAERAGYFVGMFGALFLWLVAYATQLFGSIQMLRGKSFRWAMAACIIAVIPCSLCWPISVGFGIWGIVVLMNPQVKATFG